MGFFESIVNFFARHTNSESTVEITTEDIPPAPVEITLPEEAQKILSAVENQQLQDLAEKVYLLAINVHGLLQAQKQQQELLIHVATLHEELLNQLDQGKMVMVARRGPVSPQQEEETQESSDIQGKKKHILN